MRLDGGGDGTRASVEGCKPSEDLLRRVVGDGTRKAGVIFVDRLRWIRYSDTVIFNLCDYGQKLADFSLFCSTPTKKSYKIARNYHFALHHHAIANFEDIL